MRGNSRRTQRGSAHQQIMTENTANADSESTSARPSPGLPTLDLDVGALDDPLVLFTPAVAATVPAVEAVDCGSDSGTGCSVGVRIGAAAADAVEAAEAATAGEGATVAVVVVAAAAAATVVLPGPNGGTALTGPEGPEDMSRRSTRPHSQERTVATASVRVCEWAL